MIPEIGLMIAGYIFARMVEIVTRNRGDRSETAQIFVVVFCVLSMIGTVVISLDLLFGSRPKAIPGVG